MKAMIYTFIDYELDTQLYELRRSGVSIPIEPLTFKVLLYLIRQRDRVVTKDELLEHLWTRQFVGDWALVQSIVKARRALGDTGRTQRYIQTSIGHGYRFVAPVEERDAESLPVPRACQDEVLTTEVAQIVAPRDEVRPFLFPEYTQELMALYELLGLAQTRLATLLRLARQENDWAYEALPDVMWRTMLSASHGPTSYHVP